MSESNHTTFDNGYDFKILLSEVRRECLNK